MRKRSKGGDKEEETRRGRKRRNEGKMQRTRG